MARRKSQNFGLLGPIEIRRFPTILVRIETAVDGASAPAASGRFVPATSGAFALAAELESFGLGRHGHQWPFCRRHQNER